MGLLQVSVKRKRGIHASHRRGWKANFREIVWPSMGWRAVGRYVLLKLQRSADDPHKVAFGGAIGMWVNFIPIPGLSAVIAVMIAWVFRANLVSSFILQTLGNPWTFAPIWLLSYKTGKLLLGTNPDAVGFRQLMANFNIEYIVENSRELSHTVLLPLVLGGQVWGLSLALLTYVLLHWEVKRFWENRREKAKMKQNA